MDMDMVNERLRTRSMYHEHVYMVSERLRVRSACHEHAYGE
jgi:hypothetical protein